MVNRFSRKEYDGKDVGLLDVLKEVPESFKDVVGKPFFRGAGAVASAITDKPFIPKGTFLESLYGKEPITPASYGKEFRGIIGGEKPLAIDPLLGIVAGSLEAIPTGKQAKSIVRAGEALITPITKLINAIRSAKPVQKALEIAQTAERAKRAGAVSGIFEQQQGKAGYIQALGKLKGELVERPKFEPLKIIPETSPISPELQPLVKKVAEGVEPTILPKDIITQTDVDSLFNQIQVHKSLDVYEKVGALSGLDKLFKGELPQPNQLSLLEDVFGSELIEAVRTHRGGFEKFKDFMTELINVPRSLITSFDMSAVLRQGILFSTTKPKLGMAAFGEMIKQTFSPKNFESWLKDIPNNPLYKDMKNSGLYISNPTLISGGLSAKEEKFMTNFAQKIPIIGSIVRASERAYVSFLNKLRVDVFTQLTNNFQKEGLATRENLKSLANFVNNATGRGDLGKLNRASQVMNTVFFSPRLIASRFNLLNPIWYAKQTPLVRKEAIKTFAKFLGVGMSVLTLAKLGGANVEIDPRSTDFGKIKIGNTRWDIWGGFQQWVRVFAQLATGKRKTTTKGEIVKLDPAKYPFESRLDVGQRFLAGKLAPVPSLIYELAQGQKLFGEKITLPKEIIENSIPLYLQDMGEAIDENGIEAIFTTGIPAFFGVGVQTYQAKSAVNRFNR